MGEIKPKTHFLRDVFKYQHSEPEINRKNVEGGGEKYLGFLPVVWASQVAQLVKNPPAIQETPISFLGQEDPLEKGKATHSSILAWRIPMDRGARLATGHEAAKSWTRLMD